MIIFSTAGTVGIYACGVQGYEDDEARSHEALASLVVHDYNNKK